MTVLKNLQALIKNRSVTSFLQVYILATILIIGSFSSSLGQLSIPTAGAAETITFDATKAGVNEGPFAGSGFQSTPTSGQIDSDGIIVTGLSDGDMSFGGTYTTGDYARGTSSGGETIGGIYAFEVATGDYAFGFQPVDDDMTPGDIILKMTNNTGGDITSIDLSYEIWQYNDQNRSSSLNFSYSTDDVSYTSISSLDFTSDQPGIAPNPPIPPGPSWEMVSRNTIIDLSGSPLTNGSDFYLKWSTDDVGGSGNRDEIALDDISVTMIAPVPPDVDSEAQTIGGFQPASSNISSLSTTEGTAEEVFWFQIEDKGTSDGLPTKVQSIRLVPGPLNNVSWTSQIQGVTIDDFFGSFYTIESIDVTDSYIDVTFLVDEINVADGSTSIFRLWVYLNSIGIVDGAILQFQIDSDAVGFATHTGGSEFASSFPADIVSNTHTIDVQATELRFVQQPVDTETNIEMAVDVSVEATDANGNRALSFINDVDLSSSGTMEGEPITVTAASGLATWAQSANPIIHTLAGTGITLTASSGLLTDGISDPFNIIQAADRLEFTSYPAQGQVNQVVNPIIVSALKPDLTVDTNFSGDITLSKDSGLGVVSGTLTQAAINGVATFSDIQFDATGDYTLLAASEPYITTAISGNIRIGNLNEDFSICPPAGWLSVLLSGNSWVCGSGYASINGEGGSTATDAWYIAPQIDFSTISNAVLSFDSWTSGTDASHPRLEVKYSLDYSGSGNPNVATWTDLIFNPPAENSQVWISSGLIDLSTLAAPAYIAFRYTSSGTIAGNATEWRIDNVQISDQGCSSPTAQVSNLTFDNIQSTQMDLNWDNGNGTGRLVLAKAGSAVNQIPVDGTDYAANADFTLGQDIGGGNIVVFKGTGNSVAVTGLTINTTYYFSIYEYNCDAASPTFNTTLPATGSQATNASDIITNATFPYPVNIPYENYQAPNISMTTSNSLGVFGLTLRDGGSTASADGQSTILNSITFSTNQSQAIRAAAIYDGATLLSPTNVNGSTEFTIDLTSNPITANDQETFDFELWVTFMQGDFIIDNDQIVFTVTGAVANATGSTPFIGPDAGGAQSIEAPAGTGNENVIIVTATDLNFVQVPQTTIPVNETFIIEVEAVDSRGSRDLDYFLFISRIAGTGNLTTASIQQTTASGTALWDDLMYDTEEGGVQFQVDDGGGLAIQTNILTAKNTFSVFTFTGANGDETSYPPDYQPMNVAIADIERGSNLLAQTFVDAFNARNWPLADSPQDEFYYEFTLTANSGYDFNLNSIEIDHRRSGTGPVIWEVRSSVDGFSTAIDGTFSTPLADTWYRNQEVDFSSLIQNENSVTIRIYAYIATGGLGTWTIDNLKLYGIANDIQAPSFTTGYPQYDSVAVDGFDLIINLDEAATVYYIAQDPDLVTAAPDVNQVINGLNGDGIAAEAADTITVIANATDFYERVGGLTSDKRYDIYYVLYDSTNYSAVIPQLNIPTSDTDTELLVATQPGAPFEIASTADNSGDSVAVFTFQISDLGTDDGVPTHITQLVFNAGGNNTVSDWSTVIGGVRLYNVTQASPLSVSGFTINPASLVVNVDPGDFTIADGATEEITLSIWLSTMVTDNEDLEFTIGGDPHTNQTYSIGSQFNPVLTTLTSNTYTIVVNADRLNILTYSDIIANNEEVSMEVEAVDANGNRDVDVTTDIGLDTLMTSSQGTLSATSGIPKAMSAGYVQWTDIDYSDNNASFFIIAFDNIGTISSDTTGLIRKGNAPNDLIVTTNLTLSEDLAVNNVDIRSTGNLTINPGITLFVAEDFIINGILNGQSGTVDFNQAGNSLQTISGSTSPVNFYNITVSNDGNSGVLSEVNINLHGTLSLVANAIFDADGSLDDKTFTLRSTPTYTARIAAMGDGSRINGNITWQRSLRDGPQGWRYVGTPIKGQTVANWRDDVRIQGIAEFGSNLNTNFAQYSEPLGTTGQFGFDGWVQYNSDSDPIPVGVGNKLWEWSQLYSPTLTIINSGLPTIGDGVDNVADAGEAITFPVSFTPTSMDGGGWNFYANPYPSELDWNAAEFTHTGIEGGAVYIWNPALEQYGTYDGSESINGVTQYIASGQGFFIKATSGSAVISVTENAKSTADGNSFLRISDEPYASLKLKIASENNHSDETVVAFKSYATDGHDPEIDARKFSGGWVNLSSKLDNGLLMAINSMGAPRGVKKVKLNIEPYEYGNYSMTIPKMQDFDEGTIIRLKDNFLEKSTVINTSTQYDFMIDQNNPATFGDSRFELLMLSPVNFKFDQVQAKAGQEFVVPVVAEQLSDIISANMAMDWDTDALSFVGIEDTGDGDMSNFDLSEVENGKLYFNDMSDDPVDLPDGTQLFALRFKALNGQSEAHVRFSDEFMHIKAINDIDMPFNTKDALITILQNRFIAGEVATYTGVPVQGVHVNAEGEEIIEKLTDNLGAYVLDTYEQSDYTVSASIIDDIKLNTAVTTLDIIKTRRHLLQVDELTSPYEIVAADVNLSRSITALDLAQMRKVVLGIDAGFNDGLNWLFIPSAFDLSNDPFSYDTKLDVSLVDVDMDLDFIAVKIGDVNNSWTSQSSGRQSKGNIELSLENLKLDEEFVEIPVVVKEFNEISGYQFSITWDPSQLEYRGIENQVFEGFFNEHLIDQGVLTTMWDEFNGKSVTMDDGAVLFVLRFISKHEDANSIVELNSKVTEAVAFDSKLNALAITSTSANVNLDELRNGKLELFQNVPNPFDYSTQIEFKVPKQVKVRFSIINLLGETVYLQENNYSPGIYSITWDRGQSTKAITPGVYLYRLESNGEEVVRKMMIE